MGNAADRRRAKRERVKRTSELASPPTPPPGSSPKHQRWKDLAVGLLTGALLTLLSILLTSWYEPDLRGVVSPSVAIPISRVGIEDLGAERVVLLQAEMPVRNYGLKSGSISRCDVEPLDVYTLPKVEVTHVDRAMVVRPFQTRTLIVRFRVALVVIEQNSPSIKSWQLTCFGSDDRYAFSVRAVAVPRKDGEPQPVPEDALKTPKVGD